MKKRTVVGLILVPIIAITGVLHANLFRGEVTDYQKSSSLTVFAERRILGPSVLATGIIKPMTGAEVKVGAQVSGVVQKLHVEIGSRVKRGDLLAEIEAAGYQAKADLALAQSKAAETETKYAALDRQRYRTLKEQQVIPDQQMESIEKIFELASSRLQQANADLDYARLQLSYTRIRSPIDGIVSSVATQEGETVTANFAAPTFVTIIDLDRLELWAYVDETDIGRVQLTQNVTFTVDTYPGAEFSGVVKAIYPKAEIQNNVVNYIVVIRLQANEGYVIRPEMTANVRIFAGNKDRVLALPQGALHREGGRTYVYLLVNGTPTKRFIEPGATDKKFVEVRSGLAENEQVIIGEAGREKINNTSGVHQ